MKYSHYLSAAEQDAPVSLRGRFLKYKKLKKTLKQCRCAAGGRIGIADHYTNQVPSGACRATGLPSRHEHC